MEEVSPVVLEFHSVFLRPLSCFFFIFLAFMQISVSSGASPNYLAYPEHKLSTSRHIVIDVTVDFVLDFVHSLKAPLHSLGFRLCATEA